MICFALAIQSVRLYVSQLRPLHRFPPAQVLVPIDKVIPPLPQRPGINPTVFPWLWCMAETDRSTEQLRRKVFIFV